MLAETIVLSPALGHQGQMTIMREATNNRFPVAEAMSATPILCLTGTPERCWVLKSRRQGLG